MSGLCHRLAFAIVLLCCFLVGGEHVVAASSAEGWLQRILASRRSIESAEIELQSTYDSGSVHTIAQWHIWRDGEKTRGDKTQDGFIRTNCYGCYPVGGHVFYSTEYDAAGKAFSLVVNNIDAALQSQTIYFIPDVRWIGLLPFDLLMTCHAHPETIYTPRDGSQVTETPDRLDGRPCVRIDWVDYSNIETTAWLLDQPYLAVLRVERRFSDGDVAYVDSIESEGKQNGDIWFPTSYEYQRTENGKVTIRDATKLSVVRLNEAIDQQVFSIGGIGFAKPGTVVAWNADNERRPKGPGPLIWNGEDIVAGDVADVAARSRTRFALLYINLGIILVLVSLVAYRRYRKRSAL